MPHALSLEPEYGLIVVATGSRDITNGEWVFDQLDRIDAETRIGHVIEGGQRKEDRGVPIGGLDYWALAWAKGRGRDWTTVSADWANLGRAAGPRRNERMALILRHYANNGQEVALVRFPGGAGTANMEKCAKAVGVKVIEITP